MRRNYDEGPAKSKRRKRHKTKGWKKTGRIQRAMKKMKANRSIDKE